MPVVLYFTMSLDGYVAGAEPSRENPMGIGGEALHDWLFDGLEAANLGFALRGPVTATTVAHLAYDVRRP